VNKKDAVGLQPDKDLLLLGVSTNLLKILAKTSTCKDLASLLLMMISMDYTKILWPISTFKVKEEF